MCSRIYAEELPDFVANYAGDTIYAVCVFWSCRLVFTRYKLVTITFITLTLCILIETLQLYQSAWMQAIRKTPPFGLLLGYGFLWSDLICYAVGTLIALAIALLMERSFFRQGSN
jgi:hypothetical protein